MPPTTRATGKKRSREADEGEGAAALATHSLLNRPPDVTCETGAKCWLNRVDGKKSGRQTIVTQSGTVVDRDYVNDRLHGHECVYGVDGCRMYAQYADGVKHGFELYTNGTDRVSATMYVRGQKHGDAFVWHRRGIGDGMPLTVQIQEYTNGTQSTNDLFHHVDHGMITTEELVTRTIREERGESDAATDAVDPNAEKRRRFDYAMQQIEDVKGKLTENEYLQMCSALKACHDLALGDRR